MKHPTDNNATQGDTPHVPLVVTLALWMFIAFSVLAFAASL